MSNSTHLPWFFVFTSTGVGRGTSVWDFTDFHFSELTFYTDYYTLSIQECACMHSATLYEHSTHPAHICMVYTSMPMPMPMYSRTLYFCMPTHKDTFRTA